MEAALRADLAPQSKQVSAFKRDQIILSSRKLFSAGLDPAGLYGIDRGKIIDFLQALSGIVSTIYW